MKPSSRYLFTVLIKFGFSLSLKVTNIPFSLLLISTPAAAYALFNAVPNSFPTPNTSPVAFISGPNIVSSAGNLDHGNIAFLIATLFDELLKYLVLFLTSSIE